MKVLVEVTTYEGEKYRVTSQQAVGIEAAMYARESHVTIAGVATLAIKDIRRLEEIEVSEDPGVMDAPELPAGVNVDGIRPRSPLQKRWMKVLQLNMAKISKKAQTWEQTPVLTSLEDLQRFEDTGVWPEYVSVSQWRSTDPVTSVRTIWVKRRLRRSEYLRYFANHLSYFKLIDDGDDYVVIGHSFVTEGKALPDHLERCTESESKRLEYLSGRTIG